MKLPKSFGDLTVYQYQEYTKIKNSGKDEIDQYVEIIALLSGKTTSYIESFPLHQVKKWIEHLWFFNKPQIDSTIYKRVFVSGKFYHATIGAENLTAGQLITLKHLNEQNNETELLAEMLACMYLPCDWRMNPKKYDGSLHKQIASDMKKVKLKYVYGMLFFYANVYESLNPIIETHLDWANKIIQEMIQEAKEKKIIKSV